jgi:hypothetical protein
MGWPHFEDCESFRSWSCAKRIVCTSRGSCPVVAAKRVTTSAASINLFSITISCWLFGHVGLAFDDLIDGVVMPLPAEASGCLVTVELLGDCRKTLSGLPKAKNF